MSRDPETPANFPLDTPWVGLYGEYSALHDPSGHQIQMPDSRNPSPWEPLLQALPCGCLIVDPQGIIRAANPAASTQLGVPISTLLGRAVLDAAPMWQNTPFSKALEGVYASQTVSGTLTFELASTDERWLTVQISALPGNQGVGYVLPLQDASELVRLKRRLRWTEYQASIGKLARGIAHELNNPLDGVLRYTHLALEQMTEDSPVREYLVHVKEGLDRMLRAARAFLEFSRQVTTPVDRMADLNRLIDDVLILFKHRAKFQQIRIVTELDSSLPKVIDCGLQHAIVNLLKNALDAMPRGGTLTIATHATEDSRHVELEVADTGTGISEEHHSRLFQPFFSTKPIHQGSGLGLIIAKEAVERSGGRIAFTTQVGVGTTFRVELPAASGQEVSANGA